MLVYLLASCSSGDALPEGVLTEDRMVSILLDIHVAEAKVTDLRVRRDSAMKIFKGYEGWILEQHDVTDSTYRRSLSYYLTDNKKMELIYEAVVDSLNLLEQKYSSPKTKEKAEDK